VERVKAGVSQGRHVPCPTSYFLVLNRGADRDQRERAARPGWEQGWRSLRSPGRAREARTGHGGKAKPRGSVLEQIRGTRLNVKKKESKCTKMIVSALSCSLLSKWVQLGAGWGENKA